MRPLTDGERDILAELNANAESGEMSEEEYARLWDFVNTAPEEEEPSCYYSAPPVETDDSEPPF